jgi:hypothetical protein
VKAWLLLAAIVLPGGGVLLAAVWLRRRWMRRAAAHADCLISAPVRKFDASDEGLRARTLKRRKAADDIRKRAAKVETGAPVSDVLRAVK